MKKKQSTIFFRKLSQRFTYSIVLFFVLLVTAVIAVTQILNTSNFDLRQQAMNDAGGGGVYSTNTPSPPPLKNLNEECSSNNQCQSGLVCRKDRDNVFVCLPSSTTAPTSQPTAVPTTAESCLSKQNCERFGDPCELFNGCWRPKADKPTNTPAPKGVGLDQPCRTSTDCQSGLICIKDRDNTFACKDLGAGGAIPSLTPTPTPIPTLTCQTKSQCQKYGDRCVETNGCWQIAKSAGDACSTTSQCETGLLCSNNICVAISQVAKCYSLNNCLQAGPPCVCIETNRSSNNTCSPGNYYTSLECQTEANFYNSDFFTDSCTPGSTRCIAQSDGQAIRETTCNSDGKSWSSKICLTGQICQNNTCYSPNNKQQNAPCTSSSECASGLSCQKDRDNTFACLPTNILSSCTTPCFSTSGCSCPAGCFNQTVSTYAGTCGGAKPTPTPTPIQYQAFCLACLEINRLHPESCPDYCQVLVTPSPTLAPLPQLGSCSKNVTCQNARGCSCPENCADEDRQVAKGESCGGVKVNPITQVQLSTASQCADQNGYYVGCISLGCRYTSVTGTCGATYGISESNICSSATSICGNAILGSECLNRNNVNGHCARNPYADEGDDSCVCETVDSQPKVEVEPGKICPEGSSCICSSSGNQIQPREYCPLPIANGITCPSNSPLPGCWCNLPLGKVVSPGELCYTKPEEVVEFVAESVVIGGAIAGTPYVLPTAISVGSAVIPVIGETYLQAGITISVQGTAAATSALSAAGVACAETQVCQNVARTTMQFADSAIRAWTSNDAATTTNREIMRIIAPQTGLLDSAVSVVQGVLRPFTGGLLSGLRQQQNMPALVSSIDDPNVIRLDTRQYAGGTYGQKGTGGTTSQPLLTNSTDSELLMGLSGVDAVYVPMNAYGAVANPIFPGISVQTPLSNLGQTVNNLSNWTVGKIADVILPDNTQIYSGVTGADIDQAFATANQIARLTDMTFFQRVHQAVTAPTQGVSKLILRISARINPTAIDSAINADVTSPSSPNPIHNTAYGTHARTTAVLVANDDVGLGESLTLAAVQTHAENLAAGDYRGISASMDPVPFMIVDDSGGRMYSVPQNIAQRPDELRTYLNANLGTSVSPEFIAKMNEIATDPNRGINYGEYLTPEDFDNRPWWQKISTVLSGQAPQTIVDPDTLDKLNDNRLLTIDLRDNAERLNPGVGALTVGIQNPGTPGVQNIYTLSAHDRLYGSDSQNTLTEINGRLGVDGYQQTTPIPVNTANTVTITTSPGVVDQLNERIRAQRQVLSERGYDPDLIKLGLTADNVFASVISNLFGTRSAVGLENVATTGDVGAYPVVDVTKSWAPGLALEAIGTTRQDVKDGSPSIINTLTSATNNSRRRLLYDVSRGATPNVSSLTDPDRLLYSRYGYGSFETVSAAQGVSAGATFNPDDASATLNFNIPKNASTGRRAMLEWLRLHPDDLERGAFLYLDQLDQQLGINTRISP